MSFADMQPPGVVGKRLHLVDQVTTMASFVLAQCHVVIILDIILGGEINGAIRALPGSD